MDKIKYRISLDMHSSVSQASLAAKQGDDNRQFSITLRSGGQPYKIERGAFAVFSTTLPDGKVIEDNCIIVDDEILYDFTQNLTSQVGVLNIEIRLYGPNSNLVTSPTFILVVSSRAANAEEIESTNSFTSLDAMYNKLNGIANEVQTKLENGEFVGESGSDAGFGKVAAEAVSRSPGTPPTVTVETSGPNTAKNFNFTFGIPTPSSLDFKVDPIFANNSWETIAKVARYGDPSKYWKVGDYKLLRTDIVKLTLKKWGEFLEPTIVNKSLLLKAINNVPGRYEVDLNLITWAGDTDHGYIMSIDIRDASGKNIYNEYHEEYSFPVPPLNCGISLGDQGFGVFDLTYDEVECPLQIIGFNHDKVTDPYSYGKQKAGMTLQLGASRNVYGDTKPGLYEGTIEGLMAEDGIHFRAPNSVIRGFYEAPTNWADGAFRVALQTLFDGTEIESYLTEVKKQTSHHWQEGQRWAALMDTHDKVFLPSEYEYFGEVLYAPAREGDQYELYKDGTSKFMWATELLDGTTTTARIAFRSTVGSKVSANVDYGGNCGMYLTVKSLSPVSVSYSHSFGSAHCWIAPCICL